MHQLELAQIVSLSADKHDLRKLVRPDECALIHAKYERIRLNCANLCPSISPGPHTAGFFCDERVCVRGIAHWKLGNRGQSQCSRNACPLDFSCHANVICPSRKCVFIPDKCTFLIFIITVSHIPQIIGHIISILFDNKNIQPTLFNKYKLSRSKLISARCENVYQFTSAKPEFKWVTHVGSYIVSSME